MTQECIKTLNIPYSTKVVYNSEHSNTVCPDHNLKSICIIEKWFCHILFLRACFWIQRNFSLKIFPNIISPSFISQMLYHKI